VWRDQGQLLQLRKLTRQDFEAALRLIQPSSVDKERFALG
jgi:hypothetical protein